MTLAEWMAREGVSDADVAAKVGRERSVISRLRRGKHVPSVALMRALIELSNGEIDAHTLMSEAA
ncbi:MAG: helix-turn-helix domain-containing protein [Patescibacteria group bacterium]|nr:helix-turn-helix domain-containing protein [Patescibacteria group bacterium]